MGGVESVCITLFKPDIVEVFQLLLQDLKCMSAFPVLYMPNDLINTHTLLSQVLDLRIQSSKILLIYLFSIFFILGY